MYIKKVSSALLKEDGKVSAPTWPLPLLKAVYQEVLPAVHHKLEKLKERAATIPDKTLRFHALDALTRKAFHCEGGGVFGLIERTCFDEFLTFLIHYQQMCDYLDNLCDQSDSLDPNDFRTLHNALLAAINDEAPLENYYRFRETQDDGGYLHDMIHICRSALQKLPSFSIVQPYMLKLCQYYCDFQTYKHVKKEDRVPMLEAWFERHRDEVPAMSWYEFACCTGSTLGIYTLTVYGGKQGFTDRQARQLMDGYFPYVQGVHLLLDYFIDQEEDIADDELNFLFHYQNEEEMIERFRYFLARAEETMAELPDPKFHRMIHRGLIAIYLSDDKVQKHPKYKRQSKRMIKMGGLPTFLFYLNSWMFRRKSGEQPAMDSM